MCWTCFTVLRTHAVYTVQRFFFGCLIMQACTHAVPGRLEHVRFNSVLTRRRTHHTPCRLGGHFGLPRACVCFARAHKCWLYACQKWYFSMPFVFGIKKITRPVCVLLCRARHIMNRSRHFVHAWKDDKQRSAAQRFYYCTQAYFSSTQAVRTWEGKKFSKQAIRLVQTFARSNRIASSQLWSIHFVNMILTLRLNKSSIRPKSSLFLFTDKRWCFMIINFLVKKP